MRAKLLVCLHVGYLVFFYQVFQKEKGKCFVKYSLYVNDNFSWPSY